MQPLLSVTRALLLDPLRAAGGLLLSSSPAACWVVSGSVRPPSPSPAFPHSFHGNLLLPACQRAPSPAGRGATSPALQAERGWGRAAFQIRAFLPKMPAWSLTGAQDPSCSSLPPAPWGQPLLVQFRITSTEPSGHQKEILFFLTRAFHFFFFPS